MSGPLYGEGGKVPSRGQAVDRGHRKQGKVERMKGCDGVFGRTRAGMGKRPAMGLIEEGRRGDGTGGAEPRFAGMREAPAKSGAFWRGHHKVIK